MKSRLYASSLIIVLMGLCSAIAIYLTAEDAPQDALGYVIADDGVHPLSPGSSKLYVRDLQRFGGKAAVLFDEFNRWFAGLWRGKSLAITVAWISIFLALLVFLLASYFPPDTPEQKGPGER